MGENEESQLVSDMIEGGVKIVNDLAEYFSGLIGGATSVSELREHSRALSEKVLDIIKHLINNPDCYAQQVHLSVTAAITEFYLHPVAANVCCGESFSVFRERAIRMVKIAAAKRAASMRGERSVAAVREMVRALKEVETQLATEELLHGATRH